MSTIDGKKKQDFIAIYDAYADAIYRYCFFRVFSRERAQELMQEAFMKTWHYITAGTEVKNIRAFVYRVARNLIVDDIRKQHDIRIENIEHHTYPDITLAEIDAHTYDTIEKHLLLEEVWRALSLLSEEERDLIILRFVNDLSLSHIADVYGIHVNHVSVKISRAIKKLKTHFTSYDSYDA